MVDCFGFARESVCRGFAESSGAKVFETQSAQSLEPHRNTARRKTRRSPMNFQFTHPYSLFLLIPALVWVIWLSIRTDVQIAPWRRWISAILRVLIVLLL